MVPAAAPDLSPIRRAFPQVFRPRAAPGRAGQALALSAGAAGAAAAAYKVAPVAFSALPFQ